MATVTESPITLDQAEPDLGAYLDLSPQEVARLVLCLLIEEGLRRRLAAFRKDAAA